jgi:centrosomal protein CEP120
MAGAPPGAAAATAAEAADTERHFSLSLDVRAFQAGARLPLNMASVYALLHLPPDLAAFLAARGLRLPPRLTPLKTYPAMDVARGSEGALPNGCAAPALPEAAAAAHSAGGRGRTPRPRRRARCQDLT